MKAIESNAVAIRSTGVPFRNAGTGLVLSLFLMPASNNIERRKPMATPRA
jgi:hypothetical protein